MVLLKWSTLTLALFCLAVLIRTTSGIKCYWCKRSNSKPDGLPEMISKDDYGKCDELVEDKKKNSCKRREIKDDKDPTKIVLLELKPDDYIFEINPEVKCEVWIENSSAKTNITTCHCFSDGCNSNSVDDWKVMAPVGGAKGDTNGGENGNGGTRVGVDRTIIFGIKYHRI